MNSVADQTGNSGMPRDVQRTLWGKLRVFLFPMIANFWPVLLFISQKAFIVPSMLLIGAGDEKYRRDMLFAGAMGLVGIIVYIWQIGNPYDLAHLTGFLLFLLSVPVVNFAVRYDHELLRKILTYLTILNIVMAVFLLVYDIDLYGLRGLNKVVNRYGATNRVYFESSSLAAVALFSTFKNKFLRFGLFIAVTVFVVLIAKSVAIVILLAANVALPYIIRSTLAVKISVIGIASIAIVIFFSYLLVIRPDVYLSLQAKQFQLDLITGSLGGDWWGWGWGAFYPNLATDLDQPYQVEMQLPMLMLQIGPVALLLIVLLMAMTFMSTTTRPVMGAGRFLVYLLIGFNNPWLFIPSWYLTCQLLFRYDADDR